MAQYDSVFKSSWLPKKINSFLNKVKVMMGTGRSPGLEVCEVSIMRDIKEWLPSKVREPVWPKNNSDKYSLAS